MWIRLSDDAPPFSEYGFSDPSPGHNSPHIEIYTVQISNSTPQSNALIPAPPIPDCQCFTLHKYTTYTKLTLVGVPSLQLQITNLHPTSRMD